MPKKKKKNKARKLKFKKRSVKPNRKVLVKRKARTVKRSKLKSIGKIAKQSRKLYFAKELKISEKRHEKPKVVKFKKKILKRKERIKTAVKAAARISAVKKFSKRTKIRAKLPEIKIEFKQNIIRPSSISSELFKPKIKVIGIGGGGGSIVSEIGRSLNKATFVIADTDVRSFKKKQGIKHLIFGQELTHGLGTGLNTELARQAAAKERGRISELFREQDIVIFVACLGGGLGSGATQVFLEEAKAFSGITLGIFTLPFKFEGKSKQKIAAKALKELRRFLNVSITIPNERIFKVINETLPAIFIILTCPQTKIFPD